MVKPSRRRSSGPRTFDRGQAVETAVRLFRRHGYEGVSIADLTREIGIAPPSLYAAFGSKAGLYREALDRYASLPGALDGLEGAETLEEALEGLFRAAIQAVTADPPGCMISTGLIECALEHADLAAELAVRRRGLRARIAEGLGRWLPDAEAERTAALVFVMQQGLAIHARDGASAEDLVRIAQDGVRGVLALAGGGGGGPGGRDEAPVS